MPRLSASATGASPPPASSSSNSERPPTEPPAAAPQFYVNRLREEDILALLAQRHQQEQSFAASAAAARSPPAATFPAHALGPTFFLRSTPFSSLPGTAGGFSSALDPYLAAPQQHHQSLGGLSAATILELARQRPDLLISLQSPPPPPAAAAAPPPPPRQQQQQIDRGPAAQEAASTNAHGASATHPPRKRKQMEEHDEYNDKQNDDEGSDERGETEEEEGESGSSHARPRKRVMFHLGQLGDCLGDDVPATGGSEEDAWTTDLHRSLVETIFTTGMRHASPSVILDFMSNAEDFPLTSERVKSHLQKYRNQAEKSQADFMQEYDTFLQRALSIGSQSSGSTARLLPTANVTQIMGQEGPLYGGDAAAAATYDMLYKSNQQKIGASEGLGSERSEFDSAVHHFLTPSVLRQASTSLADHCQGQKIKIPQLTAEEKNSPLGLSMGHIVDTFKALEDELDRQRSGVNKGVPNPVDAETASREKSPASKAASTVPTGDKKPASVKAPLKSAPDTSKGATQDENSLGAPSIEKGEKGGIDTRVRAIPKVAAGHVSAREKDRIGALVELMYGRKKEKEEAAAF